MATITIDADRSAWALRPGAVFKLVWDPLGITGMACRVVRVGQDASTRGRSRSRLWRTSSPWTGRGYSTPPDSGWQDPSGDIPAGTLVHTESGLTGSSWTYLEATEIAESGLGRLNDHLRVIVRTYGAGRVYEAVRLIEWELDRPL